MKALSHVAALIVVGLAFAAPAQAQVRITTTTLPAGRVGERYSAALAASGASAPTWSVTQGMLAPGLSLDPQGVIGGVPAVDGAFPVRISCASATGDSAAANFVITIQARGGISITTTTLPRGQVNVEYSAQLEATGGTPPYAFQAISGAPDWLFISSRGQVSGTPSTAGRYDIALSVVDSASNIGSAIVSLEVGGGALPPVQILTRPSDVPRGVVGQPYQVELTVAGGTPPYEWAVSAGEIPAGLVLDSTRGTLAGVPAREGSSSFVVAVIDDRGEEASLELSLVVLPAGNMPPGALRITLPESLRLPFAAPVDVALTAEGGTPPYRWTASLLPPGLRVEGAALRGTATASVSVTARFSVTDAAERTTTASVQVQVGGGGDGGGANGNGTTLGNRRGGSRGTDRGGCASTEGSGAAALLAFAILALRRRRR